MEHKTYTVKAIDEEGSFEAVIATLNVIDKDGDVTRPGAFGKQDVSVLPTHDRFSVPLGKAKLFERDDKAIAQGRLNLATEAGKEWHEHLKFDLSEKVGPPLQEWSYGFDVIKSSEGEFEGRKVRFLEELRVHEVSPVLVGAGEGTGTLAIKAKEIGSDWEKALAAFDGLYAKATLLVETLEDQKDGPTEEQDLSIKAVLADLEKAAEVLEDIAGKSSGEDEDIAGKALARFCATEARISGGFEESASQEGEI